jgi:predicted GH43/DUF377 family glycosyl hydrolase
LVEFQEEDRAIHYYATYSAYDGQFVLPQLLETDDFLNFKMHTLNGPGIADKGMALFPRKINGHYAMLSRQEKQIRVILARLRLRIAMETFVTFTPCRVTYWNTDSP